MGGTKAMARVQRNNDRLAGISASKLMQSNQNKYMRTGGNIDRTILQICKKQEN